MTLLTNPQTQLMKKLSTLITATLLMTSPLIVLAKEGGTQTKVDIAVTSATAWKVLSAQKINVTDNDPSNLRACSLVGSADVKTPAGSSNSQYRFTLTLDQAAPKLDGECERTLSLTSSATSQQSNSTCYFTNVKPGVHTLYWLARKATPGAPSITVTDNSVTASCADKPMN